MPNIIETYVRRRFGTPWHRSQSWMITSSYGSIKRRTQRSWINHTCSPFFCSYPCCTHINMHAIAGVVKSERDARSTVLTILISHTEHHPSHSSYVLPSNKGQRWGGPGAEDSYEYLHRYAPAICVFMNINIYVYFY